MNIHLIFLGRYLLITEYKFLHQVRFDFDEGYLWYKTALSSQLMGVFDEGVNSFQIKDNF